MLWEEERYALGRGKICFLTRGAILSDCWSYAFRPQEQCFGPYGAMLSDCWSNALDLTEHAFIYL